MHAQSKTTTVQTCEANTSALFIAPYVLLLERQWVDEDPILPSAPQLFVTYPFRRENKELVQYKQGHNYHTVLRRACSREIRTKWTTMLRMVIARSVVVTSRPVIRPSTTYTEQAQLSGFPADWGGSSTTQHPSLTYLQSRYELQLDSESRGEWLATLYRAESDFSLAVCW